MSDKVAGDAEKALGNQAYKARNFAEAITHYEKAWELNKDITYLNNLAAVYYEDGDMDKSIATAERAIEEGREIRADFKLIAKSYARIGTAYFKLEDYDKAINAFNKSLTEHRTPDVLAKLKEAETTKAEKARLAYIDPAKADEARELGNTAFKSGDFAGSVGHYAESIKRNPSDARGYTNRAAALTKLMALPEALKDADKAIEVQPDFVKGYIRKSHVLFAMKDFDKALGAIELAAQKDTEGKHTAEISSQVRKVQKIMQDPVMNQILQQAQNDPASLSAHMQSNPEIAQKIQKLVRAGIIKTGSR